jgi:hypothetical protein
MDDTPDRATSNAPTMSFFMERFSFGITQSTLGYSTFRAMYATIDATRATSAS